MTEDCRKLSPEQQEEIRRRAVSMVQKGTPPQEVADLLGAAARSIFYWLARYRSGGWDGLQTGFAQRSSFEAGRSRHEMDLRDSD